MNLLVLIFMKKLTYLLSLVSMMAPFAVSADVQNPAELADAAYVDSKSDDPHKLRYTQTTEEDRKFLQHIREADPKGIPVPKFLLRTEDRMFVLAIGGQLNVIVGADLDNNLYNTNNAGISFITQDIPVPAPPGKKGDFYINPFNSYLDLQVVGFGHTENAISAYFKIGTNGMTPGLNLQRCYISWRGLTVGQKLTLFQDGAACQPPTIDPEGPSGEVSTVSYEISYTSPSFNGFRFAVGLDKPTFYTSSGRYLGTDNLKLEEYFKNENITDGMVANASYSNQNVPDIPAWVEYTDPKNSNNRIRLSGLFRAFSYRDNIQNKTRLSPGWGLMVSGNLNPVKPLILYLQACYGKGIASYIQDLAGLPYGYTPSSTKLGEMTPMPMMGLNLGATWNFNARWQANVVGSTTHIWKVGDYARAQENALNYKSAVYVAANVFYTLTSYLQFGVEYLYGHRQTYGKGGAHDNRLQAQVAFTI